MNLNVVVTPYISAINPPCIVGLQISIGSVTQDDGSRTPAYATPGAFSGSVASTVLTVASVASGRLLPGQTIADATSALLPGTLITEQLTGSPPGGPGTYALNKPQTVPLEAMTTTQSIQAQVQPLSSRDLAQIDGLNIGGEKRVIYINGEINGVVRVRLKGGDLVTFSDGSVWLVNQEMENFDFTAGWSKSLIVLQNGN